MRRRYSRDQWRLWLDEHAASGLSISAFCRAHDVPENSFYYWRNKLAVEASQDGEAESLFVPVSVVSHGDFEVRFQHGVSMKVPRDAEAVRWVVDAIRQRDDKCSA